MYPKPQSALRPNTYEFESLPLVKPTGFREYDARWLFPEEINLMGVQALGMGIGTLVHEMGVRPDLVTGHDFRGLFVLDQVCARLRHDGRRAAGEGHRPCPLADGLFRPVRARLPLRRHGHGLAQRQRLDRA